MGKRFSAPSTMGRLGEWGFLRELLPRISTGRSGRVALGPGDDAALFRAGGEVWAVTTDTLVEGVHFRREWTSGEDLGHKTLAVNLSDLAAMGDVGPVLGVLSAAVPGNVPTSYLDGFFKGFQRLARRHGFDLVGGDTVRSDVLTLTLTALGRVRGPVFKRSGARPGDVLMVTGCLGDAAAGLRILESRPKALNPSQRMLARRLRRPEPRLSWAGKLAGTGGVTAALDVSDGLWRSVRLMAEASRVGVRVEVDRLPVSKALVAWAGSRASEWALSGGEDYELLLAVRPHRRAAVGTLGIATEVGRVVSARAGVKAFHHGQEREVPPGFEHFDR